MLLCYAYSTYSYKLTLTILSNENALMNKLMLINVVGVALIWSPTITFNECLELGIQEMGESIVRIAESASKEYSIEETLTKMESEWEQADLDLALYKNSGNVSRNRFITINILTNDAHVNINCLPNAILTKTSRLCQQNTEAFSFYSIWSLVIIKKAVGKTAFSNLIMMDHWSILFCPTFKLL